MMKQNLKKGFTLIELLVVISIISILSSVVISSLSSAKTRAKNVAVLSQMKEVEKALALYYADNNAYPPATGGTNVGGFDLWCVAGDSCFFGDVEITNLLTLEKSENNNSSLAGALSPYLSRSNISFPTILIDEQRFKGIVYSRVTAIGSPDGEEPILFGVTVGSNTNGGGGDGANQIIYSNPTGATAPTIDSGSGSGGGSGMTDNDGDNVDDNTDNCVGTYNPYPQTDSDSDGTGDACDSGSGGGSGGSGMTDNDGDNVDDNTDNCVGTYNPDQVDSDSNGTGDACDSGSGGGSI